MGKEHKDGETSEDFYEIFLEMHKRFFFEQN